MAEDTGDENGNQEEQTQIVCYLEVKIIQVPEFYNCIR